MPTWLEHRERRVIAALCVVGALRVFVFSTAFPPFHSADEHFHFDLVVKYAHGHVPYRLADERLSVETRDTIVLYGTGISRLEAGPLVLYDSPEYLSPESPEGVPPPAWMAPEVARRAILAHGREFWNVRNHEATEPPFYYAVAGAWYRLGRAIGLAGGHIFDAGADPLIVAQRRPCKASASIVIDAGKAGRYDPIDGGAAAHATLDQAGVRGRADRADRWRPHRR